MVNHNDKTVPFRLSAAEVENLRLLRKRMNPPGLRRDEKEEEEFLAQAQDGEPDSGRFNHNLDWRLL